MSEKNEIISLLLRIQFCIFSNSRPIEELEIVDFVVQRE